MSDSRRDPFADIEELFDRLSAELGDVGADLGVAGDVPVDVAEGDDEVVVVADLPGYDSDDIEVTVNERRLDVAAERDRDVATGDRRLRVRERTHAEVARSVSLPAAVEADGATAEYDAGVLTVTLPKRAADDGGHSIDIE